MLDSIGKRKTVEVLHSVHIFACHHVVPLRKCFGEVNFPPSCISPVGANATNARAVKLEANWNVEYVPLPVTTYFLVVLHYAF